MSKVTYYEWTQEDYRNLMLSSSRVDGVSYPRPLIDTDPDKWAEMFDCTREPVKEPDYLAVNIITAVLGAALILFYHFG